MKNLRNTETLRPLMVKLGYCLAAAIGFKFGFDFGNQVAGAPFGVLMAVNAAVFGAILFSIVAGVLMRNEAVKDKKP